MADLLDTIMRSYSSFRMTTEGAAEINSLTPMQFESEYVTPTPADRLVLVLVEPRLLDRAVNAVHVDELTGCLRRFKGDLRAEGFLSSFITADVYRGPVQKDGRIVIALRRFLIDVKSQFRRLQGVILVGNFPEASYVKRSCGANWAGVDPAKEVMLVLEGLCNRADIILADLTGNWEGLYRELPFTVERISAPPDEATRTRGWADGEILRGGEFSSTSTDIKVERSPLYRDVFYLDDAVYTIVERRTAPDPFLHLFVNQAERNNEVALEDRTAPNVLARPEIGVSRINALHVAVNPNPALRPGGTAFLDDHANPQTVISPSRLFEGEDWLTLFTSRDIELERKLLISYFKRNHRYRTGAFSHLPFRGAAISGPGLGAHGPELDIIAKAATDFELCKTFGFASLLEYVKFLKTPAVLKCIYAHSDPTHSQFDGGYGVDDFTDEVGGKPFRWIYRDGQYIPSFEGMASNADLFTHRALWHYDTLRDAGAAIMIHGGCQANDVREWETPYTDARHGHWSNSEGILFFTNCVAIFARAVTLNDLPGGYVDAFQSERANLLDCWRRYMDTQANLAADGAYNIQRKRAYNWSLNGDWTLRLRNSLGFGILTLNGTLESEACHADRTRIDGWNFNAQTDRIRGVGDFDGDGIDEFVIRSGWGMGIVKYNGSHFRMAAGTPWEALSAGWRFDTSDAARDPIMDTGRFTSTLKPEILVRSAQGIACLEQSGTAFAATFLEGNGIRLGDWLINSGDQYWGGGQFDSDGSKDLVMQSPAALGIVSLRNRRHVCVLPNGGRVGDWVFNSGDNVVLKIADLDGDGLDELVMGNTTGIGVFKVERGALTLLVQHRAGANLNGYVLRNRPEFSMVDNLAGGPAKQILAMDPAGIHSLGLVGNRLARMAYAANGESIDGWPIDTSNDRLQPLGDVNGDQRAEFLIRSPSAIGIMGVEGASRFRCYSRAEFNSVLKDWHLQRSDGIGGSGKFLGGRDRKQVLIQRM